MKIKLLLRFYYYADGLEAAINGRILKRACSPCGDGWKCAESICNLISEKCELAALWEYLDKIITSLPPADEKQLKLYAGCRGKISEEDKRNIKRAVMKLVRRARGIERFGSGVKLAEKYGCLLTKN